MCDFNFGSVNCIPEVYCTEDEQFERDTEKAMKLSLMSMKNKSVMDVVPYGTVSGLHGLRMNVPMPVEDMDLVFTVHYHTSFGN